MEKVNYDFIEVGTSCFDTIIERVSDETKGISIEPIKRYLDMLPNKQNVTKLCAALVSDEDYELNGDLDVYYVPDDIINQYNLGNWMMGCNSVGKPHDFHLGWFHDPNVWHAAPDKSKLMTVNLLEKGLVKVEKIKCYTYSMLVEEFNIGKVNFLKTDTEGNDAKLLRSIMNYHTKNDLIQNLPNEILFENNTHNKKEDLDSIKDLLRSLGYEVQDYLNDSVARLNR